MSGGVRRSLASRGGKATAAVFGAGCLLRLALIITYRPAFLGDPDAGTYIDAAHHRLFENVYDPAGYPFFIRAVHALYPHLSLLIVVQHGLGIATAALFYLTVLHLTGSRTLALVPAAVVLFDGYGLWIEHTAISETLFTFLLAGSLYIAIRGEVQRPPGRGARPRPRTAVPWSPIAVGLLAGVAGTVRPTGWMLVPVLALWCLRPGRGELRQHLRAAGATFAAGSLVFVAYLVAQHAQAGFTGITQDAGRVMYARVAGFARCSEFRPPAGTRGLCETTPPAKRGSFNQYLTGFPDRANRIAISGRATRVSISDRAISPAWRLFGPPPGGDAKLAAFARVAILHQPLDYLSTLAEDFHYYWTKDHRGFILGDERVDPQVERAVTTYYRTGRGVSSTGLGVLRFYGENVSVEGVAMLVLLVAPLSILAISDRRVRRGAVLLAATGWLLPLVSDATASVDPRFVLPSYGPLACASTIGVAAVLTRWRRDIHLEPAQRQGPTATTPRRT